MIFLHGRGCAGGLARNCARGMGVYDPNPSRLILREGTELSIENIIQENDFTFMYIGNLDSFIGGDC